MFKHNHKKKEDTYTIKDKHNLTGEQVEDALKKANITGKFGKQIFEKSGFDALPESHKIAALSLLSTISELGIVGPHEVSAILRQTATLWDSMDNIKKEIVDEVDKFL